MTAATSDTRPDTNARGGAITASQASNYDDHIQRNGHLPRLSAEAIQRLALDSGLTGRGGAGFPIGRKLAAVAANSTRRGAVVIANGAEGEPASSKDRVLISNAPHLVLDGLALAAAAVGARECYMYAPDEQLSVLDHARRQRRDLPPISFVVSPDTFISGQESAAVAAIEGLPALPRMTPPAVFDRGVGGRPTLVQNVETLAHLALIARYGSEWFRSVGLPMDPGTRLVTLSGAVKTRGVYEVPTGRTLGSIVGMADGALEPLQAILVGGYHGGWVPWTAQTSALPFTQTELAPFGAAPGAGVLIALPTSRCGLSATSDITAYLAGQSAGQCGPCRNGLPTLARHLQILAYGRPNRATVTELERICGVVEDRGACHHPNGTVRLVASGLRTFKAEITHHLGGRCTGRSDG